MWLWHRRLRCSVASRSPTGSGRPDRPGGQEHLLPSEFGTAVAAALRCAAPGRSPASGPADGMLQYALPGATPETRWAFSCRSIQGPASSKAESRWSRRYLCAAV